MNRRIIFIFILSISLLPLSAQTPIQTEPRDTIFRSVAVWANLVGFGKLAFSNYGEYEAGVRVSIKDVFYPTVEVGVGKADHDDDVTGIHYDCSAPYFKIGCDYNMLKNKHDDYKVFAGIRYAFTSFKANISRPGLIDPAWGGTCDYKIDGTKCTQHWAEVVGGLDAKVWGPLHLGWTVRYLQRLAFSVDEIGNVWYVPGFGKSDTTGWNATFNITLQL